MATIITSFDRGSSNSSFNASPAVGLALSLALAFAMPIPPIQESPDVSIRTSVHEGAAQGSLIATKSVLEARWDRLRNRVAAFKGFQPEWNGQVGVAPKPEHVDAILRALVQLPLDLRIPKPLLSDDGEIGVYWSSGNSFADLTIDAEGEMSLYLRNLDQKGGTLNVIPSPYALDESIVAELSKHLA